MMSWHPSSMVPRMLDRFSYIWSLLLLFLSLLPLWKRRPFRRRTLRQEERAVRRAEKGLPLRGGSSRGGLGQA